MALIGIQNVGHWDSLTAHGIYDLIAFALFHSWIVGPLGEAVRDKGTASCHQGTRNCSVVVTEGFTDGGAPASNASSSLTSSSRSTPTHSKECPDG